MWILLELIAGLLGIRRSQQNASIPGDIPPKQEEQVPKTSKEYKDVISVDGKIFNVSTGAWQAQITNEPFLDEAGLFVDYEIRFTNKANTTLELTLTTTPRALHARWFISHSIESWLNDPNRQEELYCGGKL